MSQIEAKIKEELQRAFEDYEVDTNINISSDTVLLDTGLDSLDFAILVVTLEDTLGYDPFIKLDKPVYPTTFGEFVSIYEQFDPN